MIFPQVRRFARNQRGAAMVEFAMVFPLVVACFCAIIYFGIYLLNVSRADHALRDAAREVMLLKNPTLAEARAAVAGIMDDVELPGEQTTISIATRDDGSRVAMIAVEMTMLQHTGYFDTISFTHSGTLLAPLSDR